MKKICFVTTVSLTVKAFLLPVFRQLREHTDWEISVMCSDDPELEKLLPEGVRYIPVKMERGISLGGLAACARMVKIFKKEKFDLVQYSTPNASLYASIASKLAGVKIRLYHQMGLRYLGFTGIKRAVFKAVEKLSCRLATHVECVSASNLALGENEGLFPGEKAKVLHYGSTSGVDTARFDISRRDEWRCQVRSELELPDDACVFGFAGRITQDKGVGELLTAFAGLEDQSARLLLVGKLEDGETLLEQAKRDSRVVCHGFVTDVERYFAAMDVLVLPSYREGFGNIVIEAAAMGAATIVSDIPGPTDAMERDVTGLVVPVKDVGALKAAMETLACDPVRREEMGKAGYAFAKEKFDQKVLMEKLLEDRKRLLGEM